MTYVKTDTRGHHGASILPPGSEQLPPTKSDLVSIAAAAGLGPAPVTGIAVGTLLLGMILMAIILLGVHRMRQRKSNTRKQQETELEQVENRRGVTEDAGEYIQPPRDSGQRESNNVYDVIQN
ncbi:hypothetical protein LSAT2_030462 [Lamellibrachia satsuma]|nr:hypothetical protein LSAT2_030462 [Lamellibrachia satsuma]